MYTRPLKHCRGKKRICLKPCWFGIEKEIFMGYQVFHGKGILTYLIRLRRRYFHKLIIWMRSYLQYLHFVTGHNLCMVSNIWLSIWLKATCFKINKTSVFKFRMWNEKLVKSYFDAKIWQDFRLSQRAWQFVKYSTYVSVTRTYTLSNHYSVIIFAHANEGSKYKI